MCEVIILMIERNLSREEYHKLLGLISPEKRERIGRFHHFKDAQRALLGDVLIRSLIRNRLTMQNCAIVFNVNEYGKPSLANHSKFHFDISHAGNYVACAIDDKPVGIDIEVVNTIDLKITERFFAVEEVQYILLHPDLERTKAFYKVWTMKEAYIKYEGKGLSIPLNSFKYV